MKSRIKIATLSVAFAALLFPLTGCSKKADVKSSVSGLEKAFPTNASAAPAQQAAGSASANALVNQAVTAAAAKDYAGGVNALQAATRAPGVTVDQIAAIQNAKQALMGELQRRAAAGDQTAIAQLKAIERRRSQ